MPPVSSRSSWAVSATCVATALALLFTVSVRAQTADCETQQYVVGSGDKLSVVIHAGAGTEPLELPLFVGGDGTIDVVHLGRVTASGLTTSALRDKIRGGLVAKQIFKDPQVSVNILDYLSQGVNVSGFVSKPGRVYLHGPTRLLDVISTCEGIKEDEAGTTIRITRVGAAAPIVVKRRDLFAADPAVARGANICMTKDDHVHVPKKDVFCVLGPVNSAGCFPLQDGMTLLQAISVAGGLVEESGEGASADRQNVVVRRQGAEMKFDLDAKDVKARPPLIEADDQIVVGAADKTRFCVRGPVSKPDCYDARGKITLDEAIAKAGGLDTESTDRGVIPDPRNIVVTRRIGGGETQDFRLNLEVAGVEGARFPIENDDTIRVGETQCLVSVQGEVGKAGQYPVTPDMTIQDAIAVAGGAVSAAGWRGAIGRTKIWRSGEVLEVDVKSIMAGKAPDMPIQCGDKITIPLKKM